ncbi:thiamine pyrophosphate-dependent enzyme, partial [Streptomyces sp. NPDC060194]|uniref:thiamine pyrophosphate-dependent enzyme n=1 Tax=Streptomyces sp. NPDC060194 TaxID=3347069 RepID=UPI003654AF04
MSVDVIPYGCPPGTASPLPSDHEFAHGRHEFARRAAPDGPHRTVVIAGDGSFFMHGMEIHTAIEHDLPITFVVFNNNAHAMCVTREQLYY